MLNGIGLPPDSSEREAHKRWWWVAHNMVTEHAAAARGGHPWVWLGAASEAEFAAEGAKYNADLIKWVAVQYTTQLVLVLLFS